MLALQTVPHPDSSTPLSDRRSNHSFQGVSYRNSNNASIAALSQLENALKLLILVKLDKNKNEWSESRHMLLSRAALEINHGCMALKRGEMRECLAEIHDAIALIGSVRDSFSDCKKRVLYFQSKSSNRANLDLNLTDADQIPGYEQFPLYATNTSAIEDSIRMAKAVVVSPGGVGTHFRLSFAMQLKQLEIIDPRTPIICIDPPRYGGMFEAFKRSVLAEMASTHHTSMPMISPEVVNLIEVVKSPAEAREIIYQHLKNKNAAEAEPPSSKNFQALEAISTSLLNIEGMLWRAYMKSSRPYGVSIFGTARPLLETDEAYKRAFEAAWRLADFGIDVYDGGGPGIMEAASKGALSNGKSDVYGITVNLGKLQNKESPSNLWNTRRHHERFATRALELSTSDAVLVEEGGIGTLFELTMCNWLRDHGFTTPYTVLAGGIWHAYNDYQKEFWIPGDFTSDERLERLGVKSYGVDQSVSLIRNHQISTTKRTNEHLH